MDNGSGGVRFDQGYLLLWAVTMATTEVADKSQAGLFAFSSRAMCAAGFHLQIPVIFQEDSSPRVNSPYATRQPNSTHTRLDHVLVVSGLDVRVKDITLDKFFQALPVSHINIELFGKCLNRKCDLIFSKKLAGFDGVGDFFGRFGRKECPNVGHHDYILIIAAHNSHSRIRQ